MTIAQEHLENALEMLESLEGRMIEAFGAAGRNILAQDIDVVLKYIQEQGRLSRDQLLKSVWRDVNPKDIDIVLRTLQDMNHVKVVRDATTGAVFYTSTEREEVK